MNRNEYREAIRYAGGFLAWMIGSGFATGQEILQFFSSYGSSSIWILAADLAGFAAVGCILLTHGYDNRDAAELSHFRYYCGSRLGGFYTVIITVILALIISVLISAAGATLNQYFGLNRYVGAVLMSAAVLTAYLAGFEKMVGIVSRVSPFVILFTIAVAGFTVFRDRAAFAGLAECAGPLTGFRSAPHWSLSALLYLSLNFLCGSTYFHALGRSASSRRAAGLGAAVGAAVLLLTIGLMNYAILLNGPETAGVSVPALYLAGRLSGFFGGIFSAVLLLGMFASCSTMLWSFCSTVFRQERGRTRLYAALTVAGCTLLGLIPFGDLLALVYPLIGYAGILFIGCVLYKGLRRIRKARSAG